MRANELIVAGVPGPDLDKTSAALLAEHRPGGVVLLGWNVKTLEQLLELTASIRRILPEAILCIDAEGGRVDRLRDVVAPAPAAARLAIHPASLAFQAGRWIAQALRLFDVDVDFAPVVDLDRGERDNALDGRYLGSSPEQVIPRARAFLRGLHSGGAGGCVKHFPGLGGAGADTHHQGSAVFLPAAELAADLEPFAALAELAGAVMVGHGAYPAYDSTMRPATLSPEIIGGLLRGRLAFEGWVVSDDLEMKALAGWGELPDRALTAFAAGCDALLVCHRLTDLPAVIERLEDPSLEERRAEALARLDVYRQRLATLRAARDHASQLGEASGGGLEAVRQALQQITASAEGGTAE
ncbi:MAG TPA: glycoside hydrolase family 3 N-terminal domain-containing protein [Thermoanaerobaculia bacterium]|nr:glycoside hydrolase family 3 N-terminal domain-containing protein [Thermoanaerobaculia bacterium]